MIEKSKDKDKHKTLGLRSALPPRRGSRYACQTMIDESTMMVMSEDLFFQEVQESCWPQWEGVVCVPSSRVGHQVFLICFLLLVLSFGICWYLVLKNWPPGICHILGNLSNWL